MPVRQFALPANLGHASLRHALFGSMLFCAGAFSQAAGAAEAERLVSLINDFRTSGEGCGGERIEPLGPLAPVAELASIPAGSGAQVQQALRDSGYRAAKLQAMAVSGPSDASTAMRMFKQHHCSVLLSEAFAELGVSHDGNTWQVVLAKPLLADDLGDWREAGKAVLEQVNQARREPRRCGEQSFEAAPPVSWDPKLGDTALAHSRDMAEKDYFSHQGRDGSQVSDRAQRQGYRWQRIGENIAAGQGSAEQAVSGWLASPGHCSNIMNPEFTEMGAAYATNPRSAATIYWTQVFGTPR
ncbi:CAP domain-containing protein [Pseudomonas stutzeri]|jgi:uncharacterized protein YkwD|nr:CAP domain-containing protein [Stutzerimonas stutzeri]EQM77953.1 Allergen V5/Tpx-1 family protein [Stutzerimonas stutzeri MF28]MCQ4252017.1 CAP domain-containing protein [Stutzerimonas stutzeri]